MKKNFSILILCSLIIFSCKPCCDDSSRDDWIQEIKDVEAAFADVVAAEGMHKGFMTYVADESAIMRSNKLVIGSDAIDKFYNGSNEKGLSWSPSFIDVSKCGTMAYTYGHYNYESIDSSGHTNSSTGVFHTVWKRQEDGKWKFVWD